MTYWKNLAQACLVISILLAPLILSAAPKPPRGKLLGPTGLKGDSNRKRKTITVVTVAKGSPADGKIKPNDVIIGVNGSKFTGDPRRAIAAAVDESETQEAGGKMTLILAGNRKVVIKLRVLGTYSATAPYKCEKTDKIITQMAESLLKSKVGRDVTKCCLLGLLATGEKKYIDAAVRLNSQRLSKWRESDGKPMTGRIYSIWYWGYGAIALSEYYLLTKDKSVLPAIRSYALTLALSQDGGGLYGHKPLNPRGRLHEYAQMNQPSLSAFMGMILARKCGVKDPRLDKAIAKTNAYVTNHIGKGAFGYGIGSGTTRTFNENGTSGSGALCMAFLRNTKGARFFSQMTATSYDGMEHGHASAFFNPLWTPLGAHVAGPYVTQQFFKKSLWFHNIRRRWDGGYGSDLRREGTETGRALLAYCLPRRALLITGREADKSCWVKRDEAKEIIMLSKWDRNSASNKELMSRYMSARFPQIRRRASWTLLKERTPAQKAELKQLWPGYLKTGTNEQKELALSQLEMHTPLEEKQHVVKEIGTILRDKSAPLNLRKKAANCLGRHFLEKAYPYYMDIVKLLVQDRPDDPFGDIDMTLGSALNGICRTPFGNGLVTDKDLFYKAANKLLHNKRDSVVAQGAAMLSDMPLTDFHRVGNIILHTAKNDDPSMHQYHGCYAFQASVTLLARLNIKEGLNCIENGIKGGRFNNELRALARLVELYGANAKSTADALEKKHPRLMRNKFAGRWIKAANAVRAAKNPRKLISFEEAMNAGK